MSAYEREVEILEQELADGLLSQTQFNEDMAMLDADERAGREEQAEEAYADVMGGW